MSTKRWQKIMVVVTDPFAREQLAATKAAAVARRCGARVQLFNTFMIPQPVSDVPMGDYDQIIAAAVRQRRERLAAIAAQLRLPRNTECVAHWDYPIDQAIVRQVRRFKPDLLISESHRHGRLARILLANTDWLLMRDCPCALWFVRSKSLSAVPRVLVAVDPRHANAKPARLDDRLLQAARGLTGQLGGSVAIVHAWENHATAAPGLLRSPVRSRYASPQQRQFLATTAELVTQLADRYGVGAQDCVVQEGSPDRVISRQAERRRVDVLVMGAVSRSLLGHPAIGGTAERVIDQVDCDVFIVKPAGFRQRAKRTRIRGQRRGARADTRGAPLSVSL